MLKLHLDLYMVQKLIGRNRAMGEPVFKICWKENFIFLLALVFLISLKKNDNNLNIGWYWDTMEIKFANQNAITFVRSGTSLFIFCHSVPLPHNKHVWRVSSVKILGVQCHAQTSAFHFSPHIKHQFNIEYCLFIEWNSLNVWYPLSCNNATQNCTNGKPEKRHSSNEQL